MALGVAAILLVRSLLAPLERPAVELLHVFSRPPLEQVQDALGVNTQAEWRHFIVFLGGRLATLVLVFWAPRFFGQLHSAHSRQAVSYHDRMAGLGASKVIIQNGRRESREEVLKLMAKSYLGLEANAFVPTRTDKVIDLNELPKLVAAARGEAPK